MTTAHALQSTPGLYESILELSRTQPAYGVPWLDDLRSAARDAFARSGLPNNRHEAWRFTPMRRITNTSYQRASSSNVPDGVHNYDPSRPAQAVLVNGRARIYSTPEGVELFGLRDLIAQSSLDRIEPFLGRLTHRGEGFVSANMACLEDALCVFVGAGQRTQPISLIVSSEPGQSTAMNHPRLLVVTEPNSQLVLIEEQVCAPGGRQLTNSVSEIFIGENAAVSHVRVQHGTPNACALAQLLVSQAANSRYESRIVTFGGSLSRLDLRLRFEGAGAEAILDGLYTGAGDDHVEQHVLVEHAAPHCASQQKYKGILAERAQGVFDGTILVARCARATSAHQENRNLVLSDDAIVHTKPHLEIDVDDVKCSHGATVGRLDREQLFYLRSRGIAEERARALLTFAFAKEMLDRIPDTALSTRLTHQLLERQITSLALEESS